MQTRQKTRRGRFARLTVVLTVLLLGAVLAGNLLVSSLASHFGWYLYMGQSAVYTLTDAAREQIGSVIAETDADFRILFCREPDGIEEEDTLRYIRDMACLIEEAYPEHVTVEYTNILRVPSSVRKYTADGTAVQDNSVIIDAGENWAVLSYTDFFELDSADYSTVKGFNGNSRFATVMTYLARGTSKLACLTSSHGETYGDYEVKRLLSDAGYAVGAIDLSATEIPEECSLIVMYAPTGDLLAADELSEISEVERLSAFLSRGGTLWVFLNAGASELPNLEGLLNAWGIVSAVHTVTATDASSETYRYLIRNDGESLSADGTAILGYGETGEAWDNVFPHRSGAGASTTCVLPSSTAFDVTDVAGKTGTVLLTAGSGASAYAAGRQVSSGEKYALAVTSEDAAGGTVTVFGSTEMVDGDYLQSVVYGNRQVLLELLDRTESGVVLGIPYSTMPSTTMESVTTRQKRIVTVVTALLPAVLAVTAGTVILKKRKG